MRSLSNFDEIYEFFNRCRVNRIAEFREPIGFKTKTEYLNEEMKAYVNSFFDAMNRLLMDVKRYSQDKGPIVLEWLNLIEQLLNATEGMIRVGLENAVQDDDEDIARALRFSVHSLLVLVKLTKKELRKKRGVLRGRYSLAVEVRESASVMLTNMFYYLLMILLTSIKVKNREQEPEQILEVAGEALHRLKHF